MRPIHGSQTNKTTDNMRTENQQTMREAVEKIERNTRRAILHKVVTKINERVDQRDKVLDSQTGKDLRTRMRGNRYDNMSRLRRILRSRNIEALEIAGMIWDMLQDK